MYVICGRCQTNPVPFLPQHADGFRHTFERPYCLPCCAAVMMTPTPWFLSDVGNPTPDTTRTGTYSLREYFDLREPEPCPHGHTPNTYCADCDNDK